MPSPRLGVVRDSMLTNPMIIKVPLGKARPSGVALPGPDFTYGACNNQNKDGSVAEALSNWKVQSRREDSAHRTDFVTLNREAVKAGLVTSNEMSKYRAQRGGAATLGLSHAPRQPQGKASGRPVPVPDITFGVTSRAQSPIADILSNKYARHWVEDHLNRSSSYKQGKKPLRAAETRTSLLRRSRSLPVIQNQFKLPQFTQVAPALDTFRDPEARHRAFRAHQSTSESRTGRMNICLETDIQG